MPTKPDLTALYALADVPGYIEGLEAETAQADQIIANRDATIDDLRAEIAQNELEIAEKAERIAFLEETVALRDAAISELEQRIVGLQGEVELRDAEIAELETRIAELESGTTDPTEPEEPTEPPPPDPTPALSLRVYDCDTEQPAPGIEPLLDMQDVTIRRDGMPTRWTLVAETTLSPAKVVFSGSGVATPDTSPPFALRYKVTTDWPWTWGTREVTVAAYDSAGAALDVITATLTVDESEIATEDGRMWDDFFVYPRPEPDWTTAQALLDSYQMALLLYRRRLRDGRDTSEAKASFTQYADSYSKESGQVAALDRISQEIWASIREIEAGLV